MVYKGNNFKTIKKYIDLYNIDTSHFKVKEYQTNPLKLSAAARKIDTALITVENSTYGTNGLKLRLYKEGLKVPICELCGQDENWMGKKFSLILDHINGISNDHRLSNLRIVCPNCNATLDTHCGKHINKKEKIPKEKKKRIYPRKVENRPTLEQLTEDVKLLGYRGTGRKYSVSDNSIRKWINNYNVL